MIPDDETPRAIELNNRAFKCVVCGHDQFWMRKAQLNRSITTLFNMDATDRSAVCVVCSNCTYIHWFMDGDSRVEPF